MSELVGNQGMDVILLAGNLTRESLDLLCPGGRFLELGKRNILTEDRMEEEQQEVSYFTYTLNEMVPVDPSIGCRMLGLLTEDVKSGVVQHFSVEIGDFKGGLVDAFQQLRSGYRIDKVLIRLQRVQGDIGTAVIMGGLGGLGQVMTKVLVDMGADQAAVRRVA